MWKRIAWDIVAFALVATAPWWAVLAVGIAGAVMFPWYLELVILGAVLDAVYGGNASGFFGRLVHTGIFSAPLLLVEFVRTRVNV